MSYGVMVSTIVFGAICVGSNPTRTTKVFISIVKINIIYSVCEDRIDTWGYHLNGLGYMIFNHAMRVQSSLTLLGASDVIG